MNKFPDCLLLFLAVLFWIGGLNYLSAAPTHDLSENAQKAKHETWRVEALPALELNSIGECRITYYDPCAECCGKNDGITYSGTQAVPYYTCAVDPAVIPLGSLVIIDFGDGPKQICRAEDIGGGVDGNHVDICVSSHEEAKNLGVKEAKVRWISVD